MSKKTVNLLILLVILVIGAGALYYVTNIRQTEAPEASADPAESVSTDIELIKRETSEIVDFNIKTGSYNYTFAKNSEDSWVIKENDYIELQNSSISSLTYVLSNFSAKRLIEEDASDKSQYGLEEPAAVATVRYNDNTERKIFIGNIAPTGDAYYAQVDGDNNVYTVTSYNGKTVNAVLSDLRPKTLPTIVAEEYIDRFYIGGRDRQEIEIIPNELDDPTMRLGLSAYIMVKPYAEPRSVSSDKYSTEYITPFTTVAIKDFADDAPEDLAEYGLDEPLLELEIVQTLPVAEGEEPDPPTVLHLCFGDDVNDTDIYFMQEGKPNVFIMDKSVVQAIIDTEPFDLVDKFISLLNIDTVDEILIQADDEVYTVEITHEKKKSEMEGFPDVTINTFFVDSKEIEDKTFKGFYTKLIGIMADVELRESERRSFDDPADITVTFKLNDSKVTNVVVKYIKINNDFYAAGSDGNMFYAVHKRQLEDMLASLTELVK